MKFYCLYILLIPCAVFFEKKVEAQPANPNGYNKFYHPNGKISAEGNLRNGTPVGYWKSYYPNGILKSEGNRKNEKLDSIWRFYDRSGNLTEIVDYKNGTKSGYNKKYSLSKDKQAEKNILISKELFVNGLMQGKSYYYDDKGRLEKTVEYTKNYKNGFEKHYDSLQNPILILSYSYNNLTHSEKMNRRDINGYKSGIWKTFFPNEKLKTYASYTRDTLDGYYREYNAYGELQKSLYYVMGKITDLKKEQKKEVEINFKKEHYPGGGLKHTGAYDSKNRPIGIHKKYEKSGKLKSAEIYSEKGILLSKGILNKKGKKEGYWKMYYPDGSLRAQGKFVNGRKSGRWNYFFSNKNKEQIGIYRRGKPEKTWIWYYENGNIRRKGNFKKGKEEGFFYELSEEGDTISSGSYMNGIKEGIWTTCVNGCKETGKYSLGKKQGNWQKSYPDGTLEYQGNYVDDYPDGIHKYYYPNGKLKLSAYFRMGNKEKKWKKYDRQTGEIETVIEYRSNKKYKIDGKKIKDK